MFGLKLFVVLLIGITVSAYQQVNNDNNISKEKLKEFVSEILDNYDEDEDVNEETEVEELQLREAEDEDSKDDIDDVAEIDDIADVPQHKDPLLFRFRRGIRFRMPRIRFPRFRFPRFRFPRFRFPRIRIPRIRFPRIRFRAIRLGRIRLPRFRIPFLPRYRQKPPVNQCPWSETKITNAIGNIRCDPQYKKIFAQPAIWGTDTNSYFKTVCRSSTVCLGCNYLMPWTKHQCTNKLKVRLDNFCNGMAEEDDGSIDDDTLQWCKGKVAEIVAYENNKVGRARPFYCTCGPDITGLGDPNTAEK